MARYPKGSTPILTDELIERLANTIRGGAYVETAAAFCGISKDTFYRWLRMAESEGATELLLKLSDAVKKAMAEAELRDLHVIDKAAQEGVWQAAAWRLERKYNDRWGRQSRIQLEHSGPDGKPIEFSERGDKLKKILTDPDALNAIEVLEAKLGHENDDQ
jgi:transposase